MDQAHLSPAFQPVGLTGNSKDPGTPSDLETDNPMDADAPLVDDDAPMSPVHPMIQVASPPEPPFDSNAPADPVLGVVQAIHVPERIVQPTPARVANVSPSPNATTPVRVNFAPGTPMAPPRSHCTSLPT